MGKGDQKSRRGKLFKGSYGARRKRKKTAAPEAMSKPAPKAVSDKPKAAAGKESKKPSTTKKG
jgi:30S ribosomal protein S31